MLNHDPVPSLDVCLGELLREEQQLSTQLGMTQARIHSKVVNVAYAAQGRGRNQTKIQCHSCKEYGHIAQNCSKKFCNYCKKDGHIIKECPIQPENKQAQAFHADVQIPPMASDLSQNVASTSTGPAGINQPGLTLKMVQQMIMSAFSAFGLQGKSFQITPSWFVDSGPSNHMTGSTDMLHGIRKYESAQHIQIANVSMLPITVVGTLGHGFNDVFVSPELSTNLISIGQ